MVRVDSKKRIVSLLLLVLSMGYVAEVKAFASWQDEDNKLELRGYSGLGLNRVENLAGDGGERSDGNSAQFEQRLLINANRGEALLFEANVLQSIGLGILSDVRIVPRLHKILNIR